MMNDRPRVLIVDDNANQADILSIALAGRDIDTDTAGNAEDAIALVQLHEYDVIFLDVRLPKTNGVDVYRQIRDIRPDAVVMLITAYHFPDLLRQGVEEGVYGVMLKPLDLDAMESFVREPRRGKYEARQVLPQVPAPQQKDSNNLDILIRMERHDGELRLLNEKVKCIEALQKLVGDVNVQSQRNSVYITIFWAIMAIMLSGMIGVVIKVFSRNIS